MSSDCICPPVLKPLIMIEYPGFVKNPDRALETMGGIEAIGRVVESQKDRLELKFRKADPLSHPAYGDRHTKKCLILRIKKADKEPETTEKSTKAKFELSVVGKIQISYRFDTLAEFQWLPMQRTNVNKQFEASDTKTGLRIERSRESLDPKYISILDDILPIRDPFDDTLKNFNPDAPLLILPAVFSRFDSARDIHQPHPKFRSKEMRDEFERQQSLSIIGRTRKKRTTMSYLLNFNDPIPKEPSEKLTTERGYLSPLETELLPKLERCFERQKVWSKAALCHELNCTSLDIKYILPLVAYHYLTGPFRTMWVKYRYDPHVDKTSKVLQTLDFRVKQVADQSQEYSRRSIHQYQLPMKKNPDKLRSKQQVDLKSMISSTSDASRASTSRLSSARQSLYQQIYANASLQRAFDSVEDSAAGTQRVGATSESMCKFRAGLVPGARQLSYQLKDIEIDEVQAIIHSNDGQEPFPAQERDGWLVEGSIDKIRKIMTRTLHETIELMANRLEESQSSTAVDKTKN